MNNTKAWSVAIIFGIIGVILAGVVLVFITLKMDRILGIVTVLGGALAGGAAGLGYKVAKGKLSTKEDVDRFMWVLTAFGLLGVLTAYFGPYLLFAARGIGFSTYLSLLGFGLIDLLFVFIGALGGRWAGQFFARSIVLAELKHEAMQSLKSGGVKKMDSKFK